jgi:hypothetical protein
MAGLWPQEKHAKFEAALKGNPKVRGESSECRWGRIAAQVAPGITAAECQAYFKQVRSHVKRRAQEDGFRNQQQQQQQEEEQQQQQQQQQPEQEQEQQQRRAPGTQQSRKPQVPGPAESKQTGQTSAQGTVRSYKPSADRHAMRPMSSRVVAKWWQRLDDAVDPISLDPISDLNYPPFELLNGGSGEQATFFDGQILAHYLVSTGNFTHPITRRDLTLKECRYAAHPLVRYKVCLVLRSML